MSMITATPDMKMPDMDLHHPGRAGVLAFLALVGVLGFWAATTLIKGAVIAPGIATVEGRPRIVQTLDGGAVETVFVSDGDQVAAGQVLLRLDPTVITTTLDTAERRLSAAFALRARLLAEQSGLSEIVFSYPALPFALPDTVSVETAEREIFAARVAALDDGRAQQVESQQQIDAQIGGVDGQIAAINDQIVLLDRDLVNMQSLVSQGLARQSQMSEMQRNKSSLSGQLAALQSERARLVNARRDVEFLTLRAENAFTEDVVTQLREVTSTIEELILEIVTHRARLARIEVRAPTAGIVHEMQVTTAGEVLGAGATALTIIPSDDDLAFELRVDPRAIDQVYLGQEAQVVLSSFDPQSTPRLIAEVTAISPDTVVDERSGQSFYRIGLTISAEELARLGASDSGPDSGPGIVPGMPIEGYLSTGDRTILAYLLYPITTQLKRAFRE